jgi:ABC-type uncharacterized transport system permease subunit
MRIELKKREGLSALFSILSPFIALGLTLIAGVILFLVLGKDPVKALYSFFIEPLTEVWSLHELAIKAAPLILIAVGLSVCYRSNNWNIGAEGQFIVGGMAGSVLPVVFHGWQSPLVLPLMLIFGMIGGAAYAAIPAFLKARLNTNEILTSLMLVYVAQLLLDWTVRGPWRNPEGFNFPETRNFHDYAVLPRIVETGKTHWGFAFALIAAVVLWFIMRRTLKGFEISVLGESARAGRFAGFSDKKMVYFAFLVSGALGRSCRHFGGFRRDRAGAPVDLAGLRLHRHYRGVSGTAQSAGHRGRRSDPGTHLSGRRGGADFHRHHRQGHTPVPGAAFVFRARLRHLDSLPHPDCHWRGAERECRLMDMTQAIILTIMTAATPLLLAAHRRTGGRALRGSQSRRRRHDDHGRGRSLSPRRRSPGRPGSERLAA